MLRRKPTTITLTTEDVTSYEDARLREQQDREYAEYEAKHGEVSGPHNQRLRVNKKLDQNVSGVRDPSDELRPLPSERVRAQHVKSREERLGLGISGAGNAAAGSAGGGGGGSRG